MGSWSGRAIVFKRQRSFISSQTRIADRGVASDGVKKASAGGGVSVWVSSARFRVMAGPQGEAGVGAARRRRAVVDRGDKKDSAGDLAAGVRQQAKRAAGAPGGQQEEQLRWRA